MDTTTRSGTVGTNHAAEQMAGAIRESYQAITISAVKFQERNLRFSQNCFEVWSETLMKQVEANRIMAQGLAEQTRSQQEAFQTLSQQAVGAYLDFVHSIFSFYGGSSKEAERSAGPTSGENTASQARNGKLPLEDYDSLNVKAVIKKTDGLDAQEVKRLRDYEGTNKNRRTVMELFNARNRGRFSLELPKDSSRCHYSLAAEEGSFHFLGSPLSEKEKRKGAGHQGLYSYSI